MKRKSGFVYFIFVLIGLLSFGCGNQSIEENTEGATQTVEGNTESSDTSEKEDAELVDEEYLLEHCGVTKEELEGIDVEKFIYEYQLTAQYLEERNIHGVINVYRKRLEKEAEATHDDYSDIFTDAEKGGYQDEYEEQICVLAINTDSNFPETMVFDLEKGVYFYGAKGEGAHVIYDYSTATQSGELSEEDIIAIRSYIREAKISKWQAETGEYKPGVLDQSGWALAIECSDGKKYIYNGYEAPEGLYDMYVKLMELIDVEVDEY